MRISSEIMMWKMSSGKKMMITRRKEKRRATGDQERGRRFRKMYVTAKRGRGCEPGGDVERRQEGIKLYLEETETH